jgi:hypothetical protein
VKAVLSELETLVREHLSERTITSLVVLSALAFLLGVLAVPAVLLRLPHDHFVRPKRSVSRPRSTGKWVIFLGRNLVGSALVVLGVALLVLPGQGILTILAGILVLDLPQKRALALRLLGRGRVLAAVNAIRRREWREPLVIPKRD